MNYGGYSDWYLPSQNELNYVLYNNMAALGGFASFRYWSSTDHFATSAYAQFFSNGFQGLTTKTTIEYVRCIRSY
jgi:hypothetical protein